MSEDVSSSQKLIYSLVCICLVLIGGVMSGLTLGLMSLDVVDLEVLVRSGTPDEKRYAKRIQPVLRSPHWTLVTLLLCNAAALEALPIFLDKLLSPLLSIILSVTAVLLVGEIIPQALCKSYALRIGNYCAPMVRLLCYAVGVISWPISKVLDYVLGDEHTALFRRAQLKALVTMHSIEENYGGHLSATEINIIGGALDLTNKTAAHGMTPLDKVFMLPSDAILNIDTLSELLASGHSRVPVHVPGNREAVIGLVLVKELVLIDIFANIPVSALSMRPIPQLRADTAMYDLLKLFQTGRTHMVLLTKPPPGAKLLAAQAAGSAASRGDLAVNLEPGTIKRAAEEATQRSVSGAAFKREEAPPVGIITIEDVIEELLQQEIVDETDTHVDNMRLQKVPTSQRGAQASVTPKVVNILKGHTALSRATSEPLPADVTFNKRSHDFVVNIPDSMSDDSSHAPTSTAPGSSPAKGMRIPSFTASDGNRRRRKPFKSDSHRSINKGLHAQMLNAHSQMLNAHSSELGRNVHFGHGELHPTSDVTHAAPHTLGNPEVFSANPLAGAHGPGLLDTQPAVGSVGSLHDASPRSEPPLTRLHGSGNFGTHLSAGLAGSLQGASPRSEPVTGSYDPNFLREVNSDGVGDDGVSSVTGSLDTYATSSSGGVNGITKEQKPFIRSSSNRSERT